MSDTPETVPAEAIRVLRAFLDASAQQDLAAMKACVTRQTVESGQMANSGPEGVRYLMGQGHAEGDKVVVPVKAVPADGPDDVPAAMELPCVMVQEEGAWKFDLVDTMERMMGGAMEQLAGQMKEVMEGVGEAMAGGLQAAFGESSSMEPAEPKWDEAPTEVAEAELLPLAEMTPLPKTQAAVSAAAGCEVIVQAAVTDLLRQLGSNERDGLISWFEDQLFACFGDLFQQAAGRMELKDRLRAVRIEAAAGWEDRLIGLDGSDLVYRMYLNYNEGYYSDGQLAEIIPGVLAGLPRAVDPLAAGQRLLADDQEQPSLELYRTRVLPRFMRRISEQVGRNVRLDANWNDPLDEVIMARQLSRWGLIRIHGAIALACQDEVLRDAIKNDLKAIRLVFGYSVDARFARYEDGTLEVGLACYQGEKGCFYEHELARVLAGEVIGTKPADAEEAE